MGKDCVGPDDARPLIGTRGFGKASQPLERNAQVEPVIVNIRRQFRQAGSILGRRFKILGGERRRGEADQGGVRIGPVGEQLFAPAPHTGVIFPLKVQADEVSERILRIRIGCENALIDRSGLTEFP